MREKSEKLFERAQKHIPGGVNSPVRAYRSVGLNPPFIERGEGSKIYDADGNEYIDYVCSWGPLLFGHCKKEVVDAVIDAAKKGTSFGAATEKEVILAEKICEFVPSVESVRLVCSGTEAVMSAIRAARGYTGRDLIVKFEGCYHGHSDGLLVKAGSGLLTENVPTSKGVPAAYASCTLTADYNSEESVRDIFEKYGDKIAALIVEPVAANMGVLPPKPGFLEFLREITAKYHSLLIFDEVITGFRLAKGGAGEYYGIEPDMVTMGKIIGGGMPLAAYGGRKDIMDCVSPVGGVYQAGTLSGNPAAVSAGLAMLELIEKDGEVYKKIDSKAARLEKFMKETAAKEGVTLTVNRVGSLMSLFFTDKAESYKDIMSADTEKFAKYFSSMLNSGIYLAPSMFEAMFISEALTDEDIEKTEKAFERAIKLVK